MLTVHQSNRLERLADVLAEITRPPLRSALEPERVVVPNLGMARWLSLELATRLGICANVDFALPGRFVWELCRSVLRGVPEEAELSVAVMAWRLFGVLCRRGEAGEGLEAPFFAPVRAYLAQGAGRGGRRVVLASAEERAAGAPAARIQAAPPDETRCLDLATQIAQVFDQYLVYRAGMIRGWENGRHTTSRPDEVWQAELWRRISRGGRERHRARLAEELFETLEQAAGLDDKLPARLSIFGMPSLAPIHLQAFAALGRHTDVHLLVLNPCQEHWGDIVAPRAAARLARDADPIDLHLEQGNDLLASLGLQGRDLIDRVTEVESADGVDAFEDPGGESLLALLQSDILHLRRRGVDAGEDDRAAPRATIAARDRSVQVHVCHSRMREVEVLQDQLLDLFEREPDLEPSDVRVMVPEIQTYAPLIEAVFSAAPVERQIPYAIADRHARAESPIADAFLTLLELPESRYEAPQVLALLEVEAVRERFGIAASEVPRLTAWARDAGIRWGADASGRETLGLPAIAESTWRFGLDRMLLGYAMASDGNSRLFAGMLPFDAAAGTQGVLLEGLHRFAQAVLATAELLAGERSVAEWSVVLTALLERFFSTRHGGDDLAALRTAIAEVTSDAVRAGVDHPVSLAIVRTALEPHLEAPGAQWALLSGRVTFCTLVPMRNIPAPIVCLLGMNDGEFPHMRRPPGFDLIAGNFQPGDRSRRDDDRYLFLDALLSARRCLYVSYVGRGVRDDKEIPPSVLVSELLDTIDAGFARADSSERPSASPGLVTHHPLHAFSRRYFSGAAADEGLFSYSAELCEAARRRERALIEIAEAPPPFIAAELREPDAEWRTIDPERLVSFLRHPARFLLRERLGIKLDDADETTEASEVFEPNHLEAHKLRTDMLARSVASEIGADELLALLRARGVLPHGEPGRAWLDLQRGTIDDMTGRVRTVLASQEPPGRIAVDLRIGGFRIVGALSEVGPEGIVLTKVGRFAARDENAGSDGRDLLELWLRHLLLCASETDKQTWRSHLVTPHAKNDFALSRCDDPSTHLETLLDLYWQGLRRPLPLLPRTSYDFHSKEAQRSSGKRAAHKSDLPDVYYRHIFGDELTALSLDEVAALARVVFGPITAHDAAAWMRPAPKGRGGSKRVGR